MDSAQPLPRCTSASQPVHNSLRLIVSHTLIFYFPQELVKKVGSFVKKPLLLMSLLWVALFFFTCDSCGFPLFCSYLLDVLPEFVFFVSPSPVCPSPKIWFFRVYTILFVLTADETRRRALALSMSPLYPFLFLYPNSHGYFCFTSREV